MTRTALVLGGGGITGIAWELGILKGLADAGVDLSGADLVVGTSAGSVVGAQMTGGRSLEELYETQLPPADTAIGAELSRWTMLRLIRSRIGMEAWPDRKRRPGQRRRRGHRDRPAAAGVQQGHLDQVAARGNGSPAHGSGHA
ncbi:MAG: patatin-like phospholipase family protein [Marmoricola sp.]